MDASQACTHCDPWGVSIRTDDLDGTPGSWSALLSAHSERAIKIREGIHQRHQLRPPPPSTEAQASRPAADRKPDRRAAIWIVAESKCSLPSGGRMSLGDGFRDSKGKRRPAVASATGGATMPRAAVLLVC
jgi:hypothetical protein